MRPSPSSSGGMPTGKHYIGWWGDMGGPKQKGISQYTISPYRQNPTKNMVTNTLFNGYKRFMHVLPYAIVPIGASYATIKWAMSDNEYRNTKAGHAAGKFP